MSAPLRLVALAAGLLAGVSASSTLHLLWQVPPCAIDGCVLLAALAAWRAR